MKGAASTLYGSGAAAGYQYHSKKQERKQLRERLHMNIGTQTTADGTNYRPEDYNHFC
jgi:vitamin B12 transporter